MIEPTGTNKQKQTVFISDCIEIWSGHNKIRKIGICPPFLHFLFQTLLYCCHLPQFPSSVPFLAKAPQAIPHLGPPPQASDFTVPLASSSHLSSPLSLSLGLLPSIWSTNLCQNVNHSWFKSIVFTFLKIYLHTFLMKYIIDHFVTASFTTSHAFSSVGERELV